MAIEPDWDVEVLDFQGPIDPRPRERELKRIMHKAKLQRRIDAAYLDGFRDGKKAVYEALGIYNGE